MYPTNRKQCVTIGQSISQILDIYNDFSRGYLYLASMQIIIRPLDEDCDSIISWFSLKKKKKKAGKLRKISDNRNMSKNTITNFDLNGIIIRCGDEVKRIGITIWTLNWISIHTSKYLPQKKQNDNLPY